MTVKELIETLKGFDENLEVGGWGHYGEILEITSVAIEEDCDEKYVRIAIAYAGNEPE